MFIKFDMMKTYLVLLFALVLGFFNGNTLSGQTIPKDELLFLTSEWKGERFPDGTGIA